MPELTAEQRAALDAHDRSVSLSAGAGCGKTFVLTERFLSYVDPRQVNPSAELDELVAITFTDAAAREMRQRVRDRCWLRYQEATDASAAAAWQRLIRAMDGARISTIHSFCARLLRTHAVEAGLDPQFETLEPAAAELLRAETVDDVLRELLTTRDADALDLAAQRGLSSLRTDLVELLADSPHEAIDHWRDAAPEDLVAAWRHHFQARTAVALAADVCRSAEFAAVQEATDPSVAQTDRLREHLTRLRSLLHRVADDDQPFDGDAWRALRSAAGVRGPDKKSYCAKGDFYEGDQYEAYRDACKRLREKRLNSNLLMVDVDDDVALETARLGLALLRVAQRTLAAYTHRKQQRNALEFDDLLRGARDLLTDPNHRDLHQEIQGSAALLMVDEFQDTDPVQVDIVKAFRGQQWQTQGLFVVGDFKQSIYRFRGAAPQVSTEMRQSLPPGGQLSLTANFRSQPAILKFVNTVFHDQFGRDYEPLHPSREQQTPEPAIEFLWSIDPDPLPADQPKLRSSDRRHREARWIARRLRQLIDSQEPLVVDESTTGDGASQPTLRPIRPGDVAILLRSLSDVSAYEDALRQQGLEYYLTGGHAFYSQQEIFDVMHLLRAIASAADELSLAGALRSPFFSLADETLFWLADKHGALNEGLFSGSLPAELSREEADKVRRARDVLDRLRAAKDEHLVADLLQRALEWTGFDAAVRCEFLGERKLANVHKLIEQARALDQTAPGDLQGFITQLAEFVTRAPKEALAATQAEGDVVRIMTIHTAKGLEFPVVVLADMDRQPGKSTRRAIIDRDLGPLMRLRGQSDDPRSDSATGIVGHDLWRFDERLADNAERIRLLYVACTRAADYLILSAGLASLDAIKHDWLRLLAEKFDLHTGAAAGELPTACSPPPIRVTTDEPPTSPTAEAVRPGKRLRELVEQTRQLAATPAPAAHPFPAALPVGVDHGARLNFSFSRLSGQITKTSLLRATDADQPGDDRPDELPTPLSNDDQRPRKLGNLVHAVLERAAWDEPDAARAWSELLAPQFFDEGEEGAAGEAAELVERFLASPRAASVRAATTILREVDFLLPWPSEAYPGRFLEGIIDCLYCDQQGRWHILDYKSNHTEAEAVSKAAAAYELQMFVYTLAVERSQKVEVAEAALYFLRPAVEYAFQWPAAQRKELHQKIEEAMKNSAAAEYRSG